MKIKILLMLSLLLAATPLIADDSTSGPGGTFIGQIQNEGINLVRRSKLNFIGAGVDCQDNAGQKRVDCTVTSGGGIGSPGGSQTQVQFHDAGGVFNGNPGIKIDNASNSLIIGSNTATQNSFIQDADGDLWILANASYTASTQRFNRIDITKPAWGIEMQGRGLFPGEVDSGWVVWRAAPGVNPISTTYGAVGGWELGFDVTSNRDLVVGGGAIEMDGFGSFPYGRFIHSTLSGQATTGMVRNLYNNMSTHDSALYPDMFVGFSSDTFIVSYGTPHVTPQLNNMLVVSTGIPSIPTLGALAARTYYGDGSNLTGISGSGSTTLDGLTDVVITAPAVSDQLVYNGTVWVNAPSGTSFSFSVAGFSDGLSGTQLIGTGVWKAAGAISFTASYNNGPPTGSTVTYSGWSELPMVTPFTGVTSVEAVNYPSVADSVSFTLSSKKASSSASASLTHSFYNYRFWGVSTVASGFTEFDVETLGGSEISNSVAKTFTVAPNASQYIIWASPVRLGLVTFFVGAFEGGFQPPETVSITNTAGFTEDYYIYRSTNLNLGSTTVTTQ